MHLFEIEIKNRVIKKSFSEKIRIKGRQGEWYTENLYYLADSEEEAKGFALEHVQNRKIRGVTSMRGRKLKREIEIIKARRLA